jgi:hypothetical protein
LFLLLTLPALFHIKPRLCLLRPHRRLPEIFKTLLTPRSQIDLLLLADLRLTDLFLLDLLLTSYLFLLNLLTLALLPDLILLSLLLLTDLPHLLLTLLAHLVLLLPLLFLICLPLLTNGVLLFLSLLLAGLFLFLVVRLVLATVASAVPLRVRLAAQTEQQSAGNSGRDTDSTKYVFHPISPFPKTLSPGVSRPCL